MSDSHWIPCSAVLFGSFLYSPNLEKGVKYLNLAIGKTARRQAHPATPTAYVRFDFGSY